MQMLLVPWVFKMLVKLIAELMESERGLMRDKGIDPLNRDRLEFDTTGLELLVDGHISANQVTSTGLSTYVIHTLNFDERTSLLTFDFSFPRLTIGVGSGSFRGKFNEEDTNMSGSGRLEFINPRLRGQIRLDIDAEAGGIMLSDLQINFTLENVQSDITNLVYNGMDVTEAANQLIRTLPEFITNNQEPINITLTNIANVIVNKIVNSP